MESIRVLLADDHPGVRSGLRKLLSTSSSGIEVIGEAENGSEALALVEQLDPHVLVLDIRMPELDGLQVMEQLHSAGSPVRILALSVYLNTQLLEAAMQRGVHGYLTKEEAHIYLSEAIHTLARGERWFSPQARSLLPNFEPPQGS